jgi:hypothetical protein
MDDQNPLGFRVPKDEELERIQEKEARIASAYNTVFTGALGSDILDDLSSFCCPNYPVTAIGRTADGQAQDLDPNGRLSAYNDGRRVVWLHIQERMMQARGHGPRVRIEEESPDETGPES